MCIMRQCVISSIQAWLPLANMLQWTSWSHAFDITGMFQQVDLQPRVGTSSTGMSRETFISNVARDIGGKIPEPFDTQLLKKSIGVPSPVQVVLLQETDRWNKVQSASALHMHTEQFHTM